MLDSIISFYLVLYLVKVLRFIYLVRLFFQFHIIRAHWQINRVGDAEVTEMTAQNVDTCNIVRQHLQQLEVNENPVLKPNDNIDSKNAVTKMRNKNHGESSEENLYRSPQNISHHVFMHNIDTAGASSFINQAFDSPV